jgi:H+/Cl- antiporter ClcA
MKKQKKRGSSYKFSQKERVIFWLALLTGIVGGTVGNFWVNSYFDLKGNSLNPINWLSFVIFTGLFIGLILWIKHRLDRV